MKDSQDLDHGEAETDEDLISKSQLKREAQALIQFGKDLAKLAPTQLNTLPLDSSLQKAFADVRRIKSHSAQKRQFQYIGKLLRHVDVEPLQQAYDKIVNHFVEDTRHFHQLEKWRDRLLAEGDSALGELVNEAPTANRQHIRQLVRQAKKEQQLNKPPKSARELFQYLKDLFSEQPE